MKGNIYIYILVMALVTYTIRLLPFTLIRKEIKNIYIKSFLYYVPYVSLAVMTFPGILNAGESRISGAAGFIAALILAYRGGSLFKVAAISCIVVFILELFIIR